MLFYVYIIRGVVVSLSFVKAIGFYDAPARVNFNLWSSVALLQAETVTLSLLFVYPGSDASFFLDKVYDGL